MKTIFLQLTSLTAFLGNSRWASITDITLIITVSELKKEKKEITPDMEENRLHFYEIRNNLLRSSFSSWGDLGQRENKTLQPQKKLNIQA